MPVAVDLIYHREYVEVCNAWLTFAEDRNGDFWFPVGPSCRALNIDVTAQIEVVQADSRLKPWLRTMRLPFGTDARGEWNNFQTTHCLRRREYAWWLANIDPNNVRASARPKLEARQRALMDLCDRVMFHKHEETIMAQTATFSGEMHWRCLRCGAPHCVTMNGSHISIYLGQEEEQ